MIQCKHFLESLGADYNATERKLMHSEEKEFSFDHTKKRILKFRNTQENKYKKSAISQFNQPDLPMFNSYFVQNNQCNQASNSQVGQTTIPAISPINLSAPLIHPEMGHVLSIKGLKVIANIIAIENQIRGDNELFERMIQKISEQQEDGFRTYNKVLCQKQVGTDGIINIACYPEIKLRGRGKPPSGITKDFSGSPKLIYISVLRTFKKLCFFKGNLDTYVYDEDMQQIVRNIHVTQPDSHAVPLYTLQLAELQRIGSKVPVPNESEGAKGEVSRKQIESFFMVPAHGELFRQMIDLIRDVSLKELAKPNLRRKEDDEEQKRKDEMKATPQTLEATLDWFYQLSYLLTQKNIEKLKHMKEQIIDNEGIFLPPKNND
ncbi:hypothetical protein FGO68_gene12307 [Halteria grandinella]|uniref:Uncharacterized protein n=1 Tax=Halteria grandinella TaxID=5974 RepID=A0A8J8NNX6_HALGN|nr:hypothetical protein FGO68_gene12307 [Halteria grandinella]